MPRKQEQPNIEKNYEIFQVNSKILIYLAQPKSEKKEKN